MGVQSICTDGYVVASCRCPEEHDPVKIVTCTHLTHSGWTYAKAVQAFEAAGLAVPRHLTGHPTLAPAKQSVEELVLQQADDRKAIRAKIAAELLGRVDVEEYIEGKIQSTASNLNVTQDEVAQVFWALVRGGFISMYGPKE